MSLSQSSIILTQLTQSQQSTSASDDGIAAADQQPTIVNGGNDGNGSAVDDNDNGSFVLPPISTSMPALLPILKSMKKTLASLTVRSFIRSSTCLFG